MSDLLAKVFKKSFVAYLTGHPDYNYSSEEATKLANDITENIYSPIIEELFKANLLKKVPGITV